MKILYHHRTASKDGQAVHIEEMIEALRSEGHVVQVVAPGAPDTTDSAPGQKSDGQMGGDMGWVHRLKAHLPKAVYELMEFAYSYVAYRKLVVAARAFKPDVIYERYNLFLLSGLMFKKRLDIPLLLGVMAVDMPAVTTHRWAKCCRSIPRRGFRAGASTCAGTPGIVACLVADRPPQGAVILRTAPDGGGMKRTSDGVVQGA